MPNTLQSVSSMEEFNRLLSGFQGPLVVVHFMADWCAPCKHMNAVFSQLAEAYPNCLCLLVPAEDIDELALKYKISAVPTFVFLKGGMEVDRVTGADAPTLAKKVETHCSATASSNEQDQDLTLNNRLRKLVNYSPIMLFMKGTPDNPQCGFSRTIVGILKKYNVTFSSFDILTDESVRQGLKDFSNWKTYPQLYVNGDLVGGLDVVKEMDEENELAAVLQSARATPAVDINAKLKALINTAPVMLFMKGTPDAPQCGFSNTIVGILQENGIRFSSFNILSDNTVREGLKQYSNWPTFPQLYINGSLIGGLDIVREYAENGELKDLVPEGCKA